MAEVNLNKKQEILNFIQNNKFNILVIFLLLITIGSTGAALYLFGNDISSLLNKATNVQQNQNNDKNALVPISISDEKKKEVYKNLLAKNSSILNTLKGASMESSQRGGGNDMKIGYGGGGIYQPAPDYGYVKYVYEHKVGPKKCKALFNDNDTYSKAKYTLKLYTNEQMHYAKTTYEDPQYGLFFVQINTSNYKTGLVQDINYNGGEYAVRISHQNPVYEEMKSDMQTDIDTQNQVVPESNVNEDIDYLKNYLGQDVEIVGEKDINGNKYYVIRYSYEMNCDENYFYIGIPNMRSTMNVEEDNTSKKNLTKVIQELYIDQETYELYKDITYLESVSPDNLIRETTVLTERKQVPFENVEDEFKFNLNVQIKDFKQPVYDRDLDIQKRKSYFDSLSLSYLVPTQGNINLIAGYLDYYEVPEYQVFMEDRKFFPKGDFGDKLYKDMVLNKTEYVAPKVTYNLDVNQGKQLWTISLLNASSIDEVLRKNYSNMNPDSVNVNRLKMNISGTEVDAARVTIKFNSFDYSEDGKVTNKREEESYDFIIAYKDNIYIVKVSDMNGKEVDISNVAIKAFDKGSKEFNEFRSYIFNHL